MRAKFKLDRIERSLVHLYDGKTGQTYLKEVQTIIMSPVYSNDPESENGKFFAATPFGELKIGAVNAEAVATLQLGAEYYLDISPAVS